MIVKFSRSVHRPLVRSSCWLQRFSVLLYFYAVCSVQCGAPFVTTSYIFVCGWQALSMDAIVNVVGNNITAETTLNDLSLELKWSEIGKFPVNLLQVSTLPPIQINAIGNLSIIRIVSPTREPLSQLGISESTSN